MRKIFFIVALLGNWFSATAQFEDITSQLEAYDVDLVSPPNGYGSGISFYDFNNDGWDDLSLSGGDADPRFFVNNEGTLEPAPFTIPNNGANTRMHALIWVDYDNDGDDDLFISRQNGPMQLWQNDGNLNFINVADDAGIEQDNYIYANACWGDYDHDGCLDFYVTKNYSFFNTLDTLYTSRLYRSNCDGTFEEVAAEAGVQTIPRTELQPVWVDVNNDNWEDLFIAVDRLPFENELYLNNQDGTFTRISESANINDQLDAMGASVADFDHNGYLDIYVGNNPLDPGNAFYRNNGDLTFDNIAAEMGLELGVESTLSTWGAMWLDYDNDSWEDLFLATMIFTLPPHPGSQFHQNNQGQSFTDITEESNINGTLTTETFTIAMGDLNNDGYYDYATGNRDPYTPRLKRNIGGDNNFLSVELEGTLANRDGIGTWIRAYVDGQTFVRYTMCGENLAGQNSSKKIFGLAQYTQVDSLVLDWNSGTHEVYENVDANQFLYLIEGASFVEPIQIAFDGSLDICPGDSVVLDAGDTFDNCVWNTGEEGRFLTVFESGTYTVSATNQFGLNVPSTEVTVFVAPEPNVTFETSDISCTGAGDGSIAVSISTSPIQSITWNNGASGLELTDLEDGIYVFTAIDSFGCTVTGETSIIEPAPLFAQAQGTDAACFGTPSGSVDYQFFGGTPPVTVDWLGQDPEAVPAGSYDAVLSDANGCTVNLSYQIGQPDDSLSVTLSSTASVNGGPNGTAAVEITGGTPPYTVSWSNGVEDENAIDGLLPDDYAVVVTDANGCTWTANFTIPVVTSISSTGETSPYLLFPNPARDFVQLKGCSAPYVEIGIIDATGRVVQTIDRHPCANPVDISDLASGRYYLRIAAEGEVHTLPLAVTP